MLMRLFVRYFEHKAGDEFMLLVGQKVVVVGGFWQHLYRHGDRGGRQLRYGSVWQCRI